MKSKLQIHIKNLKKNTQKTFFIAEIGVNHNGKLSLAKKMILSAKKSGADAVKFQTFKAEELVSPTTPKVAYQKKTTSSKETHYQMIKSLELNEKMHHQLFSFCKKNKIEFISTPYGIKAVKFLEKLGCKVFKTASADLVDLEMHTYLAKKKKSVVISVGMGTIKEIYDCIKIYKKYKNKNFVLLHCVSNYPCNHSSLNLNSIKKIAKEFDCSVGYSDHSLGHEAAVISVCMGARIIEKHFTLNKNYKGPDHAASSLPSEFKKIVDEVNKAHLILGSEKKICQPEEYQMSQVSRKSITLNSNLNKNQKLKINHICLKRPGTGLYYKELKKILGKKAKYDLLINQQPSLKDFY